MKMARKILFAAAVLLSIVMAQSAVTANPATSTTQSPPPAYPSQEPAASFVPHQTYPYADGYGTPYEGYLYPVIASYPSAKPTHQGYMSALIPAVQGALQVALKVFAKVGLFLMGGITLLLIGGIFTTAVCSLTPLCTISFVGLGGIDKDSMRSFMTPDRISAAASMIQDAIGKYQRLQRAAGN